MAEARAAWSPVRVVMDDTTDGTPEALLTLTEPARPFGCSFCAGITGREKPFGGGVSHFSYGRGNVLLAWMHVRSMLGFSLRLPWLVWRQGRASVRRRPAARLR